MMKKTYPHDRHSQPGVAVVRPDLHRLRQGSAGSGFGMDELLSALCFAARAAVWNHVENAVRGTQQPAIFDRNHPRSRQENASKQKTLADPPRRPPRRREALAHGQTPKRSY